jgi:hypothetical protein
MGQKIENNYGKQSQVLPSLSLSSLDVVTNNAVVNTVSPTAKKSLSLREQKKKKEALVDEGGGVNDVNDPLLLHADDNDSQREEKEVAADRAFLEAQVRAIKKTGVIMEADKKSLEMTGKLQDVTRKLLKLRYGDFGSKNYRVELTLEFQPSIPDFKDKGKDGSIVVELAPISLVPCSVYNFLEIARTWKSGAFHRNAGHVLQALARSDVTASMPFQEYSKEYPHKKGTMGYAGRPSGPEFYISIEDNSENHGPGSQQKHNPYEADSIIGTVVKGMEDGTVARVHKMPGREFLSNKKDWVLIKSMTILVPRGNGSDEYVEFSRSP